MRPEWVKCPICECLDPPEPTPDGSHTMEVFTLTSVVRCKYVELTCVVCGHTAQADGKHHGLLVLTRQVPPSARCPCTAIVWRFSTARISVPVTYCLPLSPDWFEMQRAFSLEVLYGWQFNFIWDDRTYYSYWRDVVSRYVPCNACDAMPCARVKRRPNVRWAMVPTGMLSEGMRTACGWTPTDGSTRL